MARVIQQVNRKSIRAAHEAGSTASSWQDRIPPSDKKRKPGNSSDSMISTVQVS